MNGIEFLEQLYDAIELDEEEYQAKYGKCEEYVHPVHGKIVSSFQEAYWDGVIYEDGYRERTYYVGD